MVSRVTAFNDVYECGFRIIGEITPASCEKWIKSRLNAPDFQDRILQLRPELKDRETARRNVKNNLSGWVRRFMSNRQAVVDGLRDFRNSRIADGMLFACFTADTISPEDELLVWSHYTKSHTGVRIGFNFPEKPNEFSIVPIIYEAQRAIFDISKTPFDDHSTEQMRQILYTKSSVWKYENERRLVTLPQFCFHKEPNSGFWFLRLDSKWIARVDFGLRYPEVDRDRDIREIKEMFPWVECYQTKMNEERYAFDYVRID